MLFNFYILFVISKRFILLNLFSLFYMLFFNLLLLVDLLLPLRRFNFFCLLFHLRYFLFHLCHFLLCLLFRLFLLLFFNLWRFVFGIGFLFCIVRRFSSFLSSNACIGVSCLFGISHLLCRFSLIDDWSLWIIVDRWFLLNFFMTSSFLFLMILLSLFFLKLILISLDLFLTADIFGIAWIGLIGSGYWFWLIFWIIRLIAF